MQNDKARLVFFMSADEVARLIVFWFGKVKIKLLEYLVREIGLSKVARATGTNPGSISSALTRESLGDDLAERVFKGVAAKYPEILKVGLERVLREHEKDLEKLSGELAKLIKKKIESA